MRGRDSFNPAIRCIGVATSLGAPFPGAEGGPAALQRAGILEVLRRQGWAVTWRQIGAQTGNLAVLLRDVARAAEAAVRSPGALLMLGGDHAIAAGTWRGVGRALGQPPGLIWIDAHMDAHTPATTPSGNPHGMPLAALFGMGNDDMAGIPGPPLDPARTIVLGVRSYEMPEYEHLAALGVRAVSADQIASQGLAKVFTAARRQMHGGPWAISLDLDAFDPTFAPGVSTPAGGGLNPAELAPLLRGILREPRFVGLEIVEYNPRLDPEGRTASVVCDLLAAASAPEDIPHP